MDWRRLRFSYLDVGNNRCITLVGEQYGYTVVGAPITSGWIPELIPRAYRNEYNGPPEFQSSSLGGKLSVLLGLAVFSRNPSTMGIVGTIRDHFRPDGPVGGWRPHHTPEGSNARINEHGLVVEIGYLDPPYSHNLGREDIERWENGGHGPIIL
ncbi:MAG: hypothetical protein Q9227_008344 [Pyrenula ochraceoflavens]